MVFISFKTILDKRTMNQLHASGKNIFKFRLKQDLKSQINKIQELKEIYQEEKNSRTSTLKKLYRGN